MSEQDQQPQASGPRAPSSRFRPGVSGNPRGRPRKAVPRKKLGHADSVFRDAFLAEANREITINEAGKQRTITAFEGVIRATFNSGLKGNTSAQRAIIQTAMGLERFEQEAHAANWARALDLKARLEDDARRLKAVGRDPITMPIHPDDIEIDPQTGDVRVHLLLTSEQRNLIAQAVQARDEQLNRIARCRAVLADDPSDVLAQWGLEFAQDTYKMFEEALPPRFKLGPKPMLRKLRELPIAAETSCGSNEDYSNDYG